MQERNEPSRAIVYIVEDDADYRRALQLVISSAGYQVGAFADSKSLIAAYEPYRPGCCILDLQTPGAEAIEIYNALVQLGGTHPFIVISAHGTVPAVSEAMRHGAVDFLAKPVEHSLLLERIAEAIAADAATRELHCQVNQVTQRIATLTRREKEVLELAVQGLASKQIAKQIDIGSNTVDVHRCNLMKKMQVDSMIQLANLLSTHQLMPPREHNEN